MAIAIAHRLNRFPFDPLMGFGALLLARGGSCAASVLGPRRNVSGNPAFEERLVQCEVPSSDAVARLYRGNAGATVAFWYSVTLEHRGGHEQQFWYSYSSPQVDSIACRPGTVVIYARDSTGRRRTPELALASIDSDLAPRPVVYLYDSLTRVSRADRHGRGLDGSDVVDLVFSGTLLTAGGVLMFSASAPRGRVARPTKRRGRVGASDGHNHPGTMSFDLAAWHAERALDASAADAVYQALCEGSPLPVDDVITPSPRVARFLAALGARYPDLDALPEELVDDSPWSSGFEYSDSHAIFNIRWSRAEEMLSEMRELAAAHGLVLYDPQDGRAYDPPSLAARPRWRFWRR